MVEPRPDPKKPPKTAPAQPAFAEAGTMRSTPAQPPAAPAAVTQDSATLRPGSLPPPPAAVTQDSATIRPTSGTGTMPGAIPVSPDAQTGVIPGGRTVDRDAGTIRQEDVLVSPESGTIRGDTPLPASRPSARRRAGGEGAAVTQLGQYKILKELGRGGMGVVYKAHHTTLDREVALKVMLGGEEATEADVRRFLREAEACAQLKHPNIVPVHEISDFDGQYYFAMEFVEGCTLLEWSKRERRPIQAIVEIMRKVCDALAYAHQRGIIHRDLKPHNVMVDARDEPKVMDFGLAKRTDAASARHGPEKTVVGTIMGTPQYMPPEQATGRTDDIDTRSDVYALGVILYELVAGELPIDAQSLQELLKKIESYDPPPLRQKRADCPWEIEVIVAKAMAKEQAQRFQSAKELADDLARYLSKEPILARKASVVYRARKFVQRNRTLSAIVATALVLGSAGGWFVWHEMRKDELAAAARRADLFEKAKHEVALIHKNLDDLDRVAASLKSSDAVDRVKRFAASIQEAKGAVAAFGAAVPHDDKDLEALEKDAAAIDRSYSNIAERERRRANDDEERAKRRAKAAELVAEARRQREATRPKEIQDADAGKAAVAQLMQAREQIFKAYGLDENNPDAKAELDAVVQLEKEVDAVAGTLQRRKLFREALEDGRGKLDVARKLAGGRKAAGEQPLAPDAVTNAFIDASLAFEKAYALDATSADARQGIVDAALEDATVAVEDSSDFAMAHRAARKVEALDPDRVKRFLADLARAEASSQRYRKLVSDGRAERTRGNFGAALALFNEAIAINADDRDIQFQAKLCKARVLCAEKRHQDELPLVEEAAALAPGAVELAEVDAERTRVVKELVEEAARALDAGRPADASALVEAVLKHRPDDAGARRLKVELAGRQKTIPGMVFVSEGAFPFSLVSGKETEVPAFLIGEAEVTNAEFRRFVDAGGYNDPALRKCWPAEAHPLLDMELARQRERVGNVPGDGPALSGRDRLPGPAGWVAGKPLPGTDLLPVSGVSWYEAAAYAAWRALEERVPYRLPTEVEWEKAAVYDRAEKKHAIERPWKAGEWERYWSPYFDRVDGAKPVKAAIGVGPDGAPLLDRSPCGAYDMYGNVHEWVAERAPDGRAILRGGSFLSRFPDRSAPARRFPARPDFRAELVGFRLATAAPE